MDTQEKQFEKTEEKVTTAISEEEKKLTSSEIEQMLKEAEAVHAPRRTVNQDRKKKKRIRWDMIIAAIVILAMLVGVINLIAHFAGKSKSHEENINVKENPLVEEKYPEISDVIKNYLEAYLIEDAQKRVDILAQYVDNMGDISEGNVAQKKYIEKYSDIECYTKEGPYENTYVVYAYYHMKLKNIETSAPALDRLYVIRDSVTGNVYVHNGVSSDIQEYMDKVTRDKDVQELFAEVNQELNEAMEADENLKQFYAKLTTPATSAAQAATVEGQTQAATKAQTQETTAAQTQAPTAAQTQAATKASENKKKK